MLARLCLLSLFCLALPAWGEDWNRFRGPNGSGVATANIPTQWTDADYAFRLDLPGSGNSSPVLSGDKLFVTAADVQAKLRSLVCFSAKTGEKLWQRDWPLEAEKKHAKNSYASNTPACDAERVYVLWQSRTSSQLIALDHQGADQWSYELGPFASGHGCGTSPIVAGGLVVINNNQEGENSCLLALEAASGKLAWRVPRAQIKATYSTPCLFRGADGHEELIFTSWHEGMTGVELRTGKILWESEVFEHDQEKRAIGSPIVAGDLVLGNCGFAGGKKFLVAMRPSGEKTAEAFRLDRMVNHQPTALVVDKLLFMWNDQGVVSCHDAATGKAYWQKRVGGNYAGSPICVGKAIYAMSQDGEAVVLAASAEFQELGRMKLPNGSSATPAVGAGLLWLRVEDKLLAVGKR
jgi:outer membrane protein assembly factor BamB